MFFYYFCLMIEGSGSVSGSGSGRSKNIWILRIRICSSHGNQHNCQLYNDEMHGSCYEFQATLSLTVYYYVTADQILSLHFIVGRFCFCEFFFMIMPRIHGK
jgi:hypothetical protein